MQACRTCFSRYDLSPLFGEFSVVKFSCNQLFLATGVEIAPNDGLPQSACRSCIKNITRALDLRELSKKVDQMLRNIVKHDIIIKTEKDFDADNMLQSNMVNTASSVGGTLKINDNFVSSNQNVTRMTPQYKYEELNDMKESHHIDTDDSNNDDISLATEANIDIKPTLEIRNDNKYCINIISQSDPKKIKGNSEIDNDNDDLPLVNYQEITDNKPIIDNDDIKEENDKYDRDKSSDNKDISVPNDNNKLNYVSIINKNSNGKARQSDSDTEYNKYMKIYCNKQIIEEDITEADMTSGRISNIRIEDYMSSKDIDELFNDAEMFRNDNGEDQNTEIPRTDQNRPNSESVRRKFTSKIVDGKDRYTNYFIQMMGKKKGCPNGRKEMKRNLDRRTAELDEKYKKLLSLAVTPYHPRGPVQCKICHRRLQTVANFKSHAKTHFEPEFTCEFQNCGKRFNSRNHMYYHQQRKHGREKRLACSQCAFRAVDRLTLRNHERAAHTGERPYVCDECGAAFRMRNNIIQHMTMHFGVRNVQCELCPALFTRRSQLWQHQNSVHFLTYTYHCYLCPETYKGLAPVKKHLLTVHGVPQVQQLKIQCVKTRKEDAANTPVPQNTNFCP